MVSRILFCSIVLAFYGCADKTPPTWPADGEVSVETGNRSATLRWPSPNDDKGVTQVILRRDGELIAELDGDATTFTVEDLGDSEELRVEIVARDEAGNRSEPLFGTGRTADSTPPSWPASALVVHRDGHLHWNAARDTVGVSDYVVRNGTEELATTVERVLPFEGDASGVSVVARDAAGNESAPLAYREATAEEIAEVTEEAQTEEEPTRPAITQMQTATAVSDAVRARIGPANLERIRRAAGVRHGVIGATPTPMIDRNVLVRPGSEMRQRRP